MGSNDSNLKYPTIFHLNLKYICKNFKEKWLTLLAFNLLNKKAFHIKSLIHCLQRQLCICSFVVLFSSPLLIIRWIIDWCAKSLLLGAHKWPQGNRIIRFYYCRDRAILLLIDINISCQTFALNITEKKCFIHRQAD